MPDGVVQRRAIRAYCQGLFVHAFRVVLLHALRPAGLATVVGRVTLLLTLPLTLLVHQMLPARFVYAEALRLRADERQGRLEVHALVVVLGAVFLRLPACRYVHVLAEQPRTVTVLPPLAVRASALFLPRRPSRYPPPSAPLRPSVRDERLTHLVRRAAYVRRQASAFAPVVFLAQVLHAPPPVWAVEVLSVLAAK